MNERKKVVNVAIIGIGSHFESSHIEYLLSIKECKIVGVCDLDPEKMEIFVEKYGKEIKKYESEEALLADSDVDAVMIFTPDKFHAKSLYDAVHAGKHVFVEKPMATSTRGLLLLEDALRRAKENGLVVTSCHPRRFNPPYMSLVNNVKHINKRLFGKIISVKMNFSYQRSDSTDKHVGLLMDHINHEIDYLNFLLGHSSFTAHKIRDCYDLYEVFGFREKDQVSFSFHGMRRLTNKAYKESVEVTFEGGVIQMFTLITPTDNLRENADIQAYKDNRFSRGQAVAHNIGQLDLYHYNNEAQKKETLYIRGADYRKSFFEINNNFINTIRGYTENYLTYEDLLINTTTSVKLTENYVAVIDY